MSLKYIVDSLEGLEPAIAALYEPVDGKFRLNVEGVAPREKLEEFRNNNIALLQKLDGFKDIDPAKYRELQTLQTRVSNKELIEAGKLDEVVQSRISQMKTEHDQLVQQLQGKLTAADKQLESLLIDSAVRMQAMKQKVLPTAVDDVMLRARMSFKIVEGRAVPHDGDKPVYGKDGVNPMSVEEWINGLSKNAPHLFESSSGGGARGSGSGQQGGDRSKMSATQKIAAGLNG